MSERNIILENLDEKDILILRTLQQNAKLTTKQVAAECHLSLTPVFERIKRLENEGYIKRYITVLDAEKLHRGFIVFCSVRMSHMNKVVAEDFCERIRNIPEVTECYNTSGDFDYIIKVFVRNMPHYQDFVLNRLGEMESIGSVHSVFVIGTVKCLHSVPVAK